MSYASKTKVPADRESRSLMKHSIPSSRLLNRWSRSVSCYVDPLPKSQRRNP